MEINYSSYNCILDMHNHIIKNAEWVNFVRDFNDDKGFISCDDEIIHTIYNIVNAENDIHSGTSFALCLRACQSIFKGLRTLHDYNV
jgi:hypothetical protein